MSAINPAAKAAQDQARRQNGEFGNQQHSAPEQLNQHPGGGEPVSFTVAYKEYRYGLPTPRHRKQQEYYVDADMKLQIPSYRSDQAPIGATPATEPGRHDRRKEFVVVDGRWAYKVSDDPDAWLKEKAGRHLQPEEAGNIRDSIENDHVLIDGEVWATDQEPGYYVTTFGMGGNHGGTALFADSLGRHQTNPADGSAPSDSIFRASELEAAKAKAIEVAMDRGDTESVGGLERFGETWDITPDAMNVETIWHRPVELSFGEDVRFQYPKPDVRDPSVQRKAQAQLAEINQQLEHYGVKRNADTDDGEPQPTIDWTRISESDKRSYGHLLLQSHGIEPN